MGSDFLSFSTTRDDGRKVRRLSCSLTGVWTCKRADTAGESFGKVCGDLTYSQQTPPMCRHIMEMVNGKQGTFAYKVGLPNTTWTSAPPSAPPGAAATTTTTTETTTETHNDAAPIAAPPPSDAHASLANFGLPAADAAADGDGASADDDATTISGASRSTRNAEEQAKLVNGGVADDD